MQGNRGTSKGKVLIFMQRGNEFCTRTIGKKANQCELLFSQRTFLLPKSKLRSLQHQSQSFSAAPRTGSGVQPEVGQCELRCEDSQLGHNNY